MCCAAEVLVLEVRAKPLVPAPFMLMGVSAVVSSAVGNAKLSKAWRRSALTRGRGVGNGLSLVSASVSEPGSRQLQPLLQNRTSAFPC